MFDAAQLETRLAAAAGTFQGLPESLLPDESKTGWEAGGGHAGLSEGLARPPV